MYWIVRAYDSQDKVIASWAIADRTENEAFNEASADIQKMGEEVADWTMMPSKYKKGDRVRVHPFSGEPNKKGSPILAYGTIIGTDPMGEGLYSVLQKSHLRKPWHTHRCEKGCLIVTCEHENELSLVEEKS